MEKDLGRSQVSRQSEQNTISYSLYVERQKQILITFAKAVKECLDNKRNPPSNQLRKELTITLKELTGKLVSDSGADSYGFQVGIRDMRWLTFQGQHRIDPRSTTLAIN